MATRTHNLPFLIRLSLALLLFFVFSACTNPMRETFADLDRHNTNTAFESSIPSGHGIGPYTEIEFNAGGYWYTGDGEPGDFTDRPLESGGTMADEGEITWDTERGLVTLTPATAWTVRPDHTVSFSCTDVTGIEYEFSGTFAVVDNTYHVSPGGSDANSGAADAPLANVGEACDRAYRYFGSRDVEIRVAAGTYDGYFVENIASHPFDDAHLWNSEIQVYNNQVLTGGWSADFSERDPAVHESVIVAVPMPAVDGDYTSSPHHTIRVRDAGEGTVIDGFTLVGCRSEYARTLDINDSSVTVNNCAIVAFTGPAIECHDGASVFTNNEIVSWGSLVTVDVALVGGAPVFTGNVIRSTGLMYYSEYFFSTKCGFALSEGCDALIEGNKIHLAKQMDCPTEALRIANSDPVIRNNIIDAGIGPDCCAIACYSSSPAIVNNTICVGTGSQWQYDDTSLAAAIACAPYGGSPDTPSNPVIRNNLMVATGENYANHELIRVANALSEPAALAYNTYSEFTLGLPADLVTNGESPVHLRHCLDTETWQILDNAPAVVKSGAEDLSADFQADIAGSSRPAGSWSRGAWQW